MRRAIQAVAVASIDLELARAIQAFFGGFRLYTNDDPIGVECGAALKNIIAIGAGILTASRENGAFSQAVSIAVAKRPGTNATALAEARRRARSRRCAAGSSRPTSQVEVTRNYGETAGEKSNELIEHLLIATLSVIALIAAGHGLALGGWWWASPSR